MRPGYTHSVVHNLLILKSLTRILASVAVDAFVITIVIQPDGVTISVIAIIATLGFLIDWDVSLTRAMCTLNQHIGFAGGCVM